MSDALTDLRERGDVPWFVGLLLRSAERIKTAPWDRTTMRLSNGYCLLNHVNAVATAWGVPRVLFLVQQRGELVAVMTVAAAYGVFCGLQVTDFNSKFGCLCSHVI